ncbi:MAG TPA: glutathione S-transferase family protein [Caulobacteraceae bacterium]|jgi:glutathione S-transferase|nr:glutathione S-transferase family protein [Caulobacteraceae bacterium]
MITLLGRRSSINVQKVEWALREIQLEFEQEEVGGRFGGLQTNRFLALNPNARVPVLTDGDTVVWDSHAIVRYLCARYAAERLWPENSVERARPDQWMEWCATTLQPAFMGYFWGWYRTPENERDADRNAVLLAQSHAAFRLADRHMAEAESEHLTMAGLVVGAQLYRYFTLDIDRPSLPRLEAWYATLEVRSSYRDAVMQSYEELKGRLSF